MGYESYANFYFNTILARVTLKFKVFKVFLTFLFFVAVKINR